MEQMASDFSVLDEFGFEYPPVGIKYSMQCPEGIPALKNTMALCEMVKEAQRSNEAFYITAENEDCSGKYVLGMAQPPAAAAGGQIGIKFGIFNEPRANSRLLDGAPEICCVLAGAKPDVRAGPAGNCGDPRPG